MEWTIGAVPRKVAAIEMNKSPLPKVLLGILTILALWCLVLCYLYTSRMKQLRQNQLLVNQMNMKQQVLNLLINDTVEFSKTHPTIEPILQSAGIVRPPSAPATPPRAGSK